MHKKKITYILVPVIIFAALFSVAALAELFVLDSAKIGQMLHGNYLIVITGTLLWLIAGWVINRLINYFLWDGLIEKITGQKIPRLIRNVSSFILLILTLSAIMGFIFELPLTGLFATSGVLGLVLGFALQKMIADFFTGIAVNIDKPYIIGDWVIIHNRDYSAVGEVMEVNWRTTRLRTEENNYVIIPNSTIGISTLTNYHKKDENSRFEFVLCLDHEVPVERAKRVIFGGIYAVLGTHGLLKKPEPEVLLFGISRTGIDYKVRYWIKPWIKNQSSPAKSMDLLQQSIAHHLSEAGIAFAYPKSEVYYQPLDKRNLDAGTPEDRVKLLRRIEIFHPLDDEEISLLAGAMQQRFYEKGEYVIRQHEVGQSMYVVFEGCLEVCIKAEDTEKEKVVAKLIPGQFLGEMSMLTGDKRAASVRAETDSVLFEITHLHVKPVFEQRPELLSVLADAVAKRRIQLTEAASNLSDKEKHEKAKNLSEQIFAKMNSFFKIVFH
ncbi:MAG: mechanosensitive ion channel family protein [Ignavibacteriaceae bacterium]|nr:mechanosensitive ion channel family protein [Ignavibacteriaceae bacterium]